MVRRRGTPDGQTVGVAQAETPRKPRRQRGFFELLRRFWGFTNAGGLSGNHRPGIVLALSILTVTTGIALIVPASTKFALDYVLTDHPGPAGLPAWAKPMLEGVSRERMLWLLGGFMIATTLVAVGISTIGRWQMTRITKRVQVAIRNDAFEHASRLPLHRVQHYKSGGMASLLREDAGMAGDLLFSLIYNPWRAIVQLLGTMVILAFVDWRMLVGALLLLPAVWVTHRTWIGRIRPYYRDAKAIRQQLDATTTEVFGGMRVVRGFSREHAEAARFTVTQHYVTRVEVVTWWWSRILEIVWAIMIPTASAGVMIYGGTQVLRGNLTIGDVMMFSTYLLMLLGPLETLTSTATNVQNNLAALDRVLDLHAEPLEFAGAGHGKAVPPDSPGRIDVEDVYFTYPRPTSKPASPGGADATPAPEPVIRGVTLRVNAGETVALVGPSGSGKTTLCNLVARFYDPTSGRILLDGVDLRDVEVRSYRRLLGIVEQDVFLFDGTIGENIAYARRDASREEVEHAAKVANAHGFIAGLERGYDTVIGERGVRLSGGQKQRIAIARAVLANPRILILDEATSNLDTESERLIQQSLGTLMHARTCLVIAHRLSTIRSASRIVVLEHGQVTEQGTHEELLARGGRYAELLRIQVEGHAPTPREGPSPGPVAAPLTT